jgi:hypothetical protein
MPEKHDAIPETQIQQFAQTLARIKLQLDTGRHLPGFTDTAEEQLRAVIPCFLQLNDRRVRNGYYLEYRDRCLINRFVRMLHDLDPDTFHLRYITPHYSSY